MSIPLFQLSQNIRKEGPLVTVLLDITVGASHLAITAESLS